MQFMNVHAISIRNVRAGILSISDRVTLEIVAEMYLIDITNMTSVTRTSRLSDQTFSPCD